MIVSVNLPLDVILLVTGTETLGDLPMLFCRGIIRQLTQCQEILINSEVDIEMSAVSLAVFVIMME